CCFFFFQAEDGIRDRNVTGVQTCALPICHRAPTTSPATPAAGCAGSPRSGVPRPARPPRFRGRPPRRRPVTRAGGPARSVRGPGRGRGRATTSAGPCRRCPSRDSPATRPHGRPTTRAAPGWGASGAPCPPSQREVGAELVRCDVPPVVLPLATLVAEEEL